MAKSKPKVSRTERKPPPSPKKDVFYKELEVRIVFKVK